MNIAIVSSLAILVFVVASISATAVKSPRLFKLALNFFFRKKKLTVLTVLALMVGSSIITGSLAVGDSMRFAVVEGVYDNLGQVDEVAYSSSLFNESIFESVSNDIALTDMTDAIAPLIILKGSVRNKATGSLESKANVIGYNDSLLAFGDFLPVAGGIFTEVLDPGEAVINQHLADKIGARQGDLVAITMRNPEFSVESIYSYLTKQSTANISIKIIVKNSNLGRLNLETDGKMAGNLFLNLSYLQNAIGAQSRINTMVVSNSGNEREGLRLTSEAVKRLQESLDEAVGYRDVRFSVDVFDYIRVENENIFFDVDYLDIMESIAGQVPGIEAISPLTSYFVNNISFGGNYIPYSTVSGIDPTIDYSFGPFIDNSSGEEVIGEMQDDEIIITNYTSQRLGARVSDVVTLNYTIYSRTFRPIYRTATFTVKYVVDLVGKADDENIMPPFPGIRGKASCADWDPPWVEGDKMRSEMEWEDLYYWQAYGGTPKAYITLRKAQILFSNDLGNLTTIKVKGDNPALLASRISSQLSSSVTAGDAGITVAAIKEQGIESAEGVQLLTETFLAFGAVVVIAGIILVAALVGVIIEGRRKEVGILKALGYKRGQITGTFAFEGFFLSILSSSIGIVVGLLVAWVCILLTNTFWSNIVEGTTVSLHFTLETLWTGYASGFLLSFLAFTIFAYWTSGILLTRTLKELDVTESAEKTGFFPRFLAILGAVFTISYLLLPLDESVASLLVLTGPVFLLLFSPFFFQDVSLRKDGVLFGMLLAIPYISAIDVYFVLSSESIPFLLFFASGFAIILSLVVWLWTSMRSIGSFLSGILSGPRSYPTVPKMALLSPSRRARRTCLAISLFAVVIFTFLGLSVNISGQQLNIQDIIEHQGGGYDVIAESSISLRFDLGSVEERLENNITGFPENVEVVQFLTFGQVGGSCSNLRRNLPPRLISANESFVQESTLRFQVPRGGASSVWSRLYDIQEDGSIPAIGDYNTIVWILEKNIGDHLQITDEEGNERQLVIVGILENSIFPGSVFVSEDNMDYLHPTTAEYDFFLFKTNDVTSLVSYLESSLQAYGMDARPVDEVVRDNLSVEWSYMSLFQAFLMFGLLIGILGLAAFSSRSVEERRHEIGTMRSLGFKSSAILRIFLLESLYTASLGVVIGIIAGLLVSFAFFGQGGLLGYGAAIPWIAMIAVIAIVTTASLLATLMPAKRAAGMHPVEALKREQ